MLKPIKSKVYSSIIKPIKYKISRHKCPVCMNGVNLFLTFGHTTKRENAQCPKCGSLERDRLTWMFMKQKLTLLKKLPNKVLHVAPELVFQHKFRKLLGDKYVTADLYRNDVDVKMDIAAIQFPKKTFDFIYCSHVLEHVPDDRKAISELYRVLTNGGNAIILVPVFGKETYEGTNIDDPEERKKLFGQEDHVRRYGEDFTDRLCESGFKVEIVSRTDFLDTATIHNMAITEASGKIFYCSKS